MRVAGALERKGCADRDIESASRGELEELGKPVLQALRRKEAGQREPVSDWFLKMIPIRSGTPSSKL